jgi:hypothetical protein
MKYFVHMSITRYKEAQLKTIKCNFGFKGKEKKEKLLTKYKY